MLNMRLRIVGLIFLRELRDQLRDRRTLFMVLVLPIFLYPMLGLLSLQLTAAFAAQTRLVVVVGAERLPASPPLLNPARDGFAPELFYAPSEISLYRVLAVEPGSGWDEPGPRAEALREGDAVVVVIVPENLTQQLDADTGAPSLDVISDSGRELSRDSARVVRELIDNWSRAIVHQRLERDQKPASYIEPVETRSVDVARVRGSSSNVWARMFPFLIVLMALTGAFYPAVDLCAGEKERGTMETLLITPATRPEIVSGKFLTVMTASIATALANLLSMALTGLILMGQPLAPTDSVLVAAPPLAMPSAAAILWIILLLVPLSAFFSALTIALAALARSMKEGQYYLTPLFLIVMPLVFATVIPGVELNALTALLPITGPSLLLRALIQEQYVAAQTYFLPVLLPLLLYAALSLRWAVAQFQSEAVLFRDTDRFEPVAWMRHLVRDCGTVPTPSQALFAFALLVTLAYFGSRLIEPNWFGVVQSQFAFVAAPILALTLLLTSSPRDTLLLRPTPWLPLALSFLLAVALNPLVAALRVWIEAAMPISSAAAEAVSAFVATIPNLAVAILVLALLPAVCEELAFRGFILQGLRNGFRPITALLLSAFLFGFLHLLQSLMQQFFSATLMGLVLGLLAMRTQSLWPCILFHFTNNALAILLPTWGSESRLPDWLFSDPASAVYHGYWVAASAVATTLLLLAFCGVTRPSQE